jgi:OmcA/MtrC family decaheme c-type cytochrome
VVLCLVATFALVGCDGDNGKRGQPGVPGDDGDDGLPATKLFTLKAETPPELAIDVIDITIASPPVVRFTLEDPAGRGAVDLGSAVSSGRLNWIRFSMAKLVPGVNNDPDVWNDYVNGERVPANLVDHGDGSYTYTFAKDLGEYSLAIPYDPTLTHRLAMQSSGGSWAPVNFVYDFVPAQLPGPGFVLPLTHDIVTTDACNECHVDLTVHGSRFETKYCVVCHNPTLGDGDMPLMVHAIHAASIRETPYELAGEDYSHIGYPQDVRHCLKCHKGPDGDSYKTRPSMVACGSCHDDIDFANGVGHFAQVSNQFCAGCHTPELIEGYHLTDNATENNPGVPAGAVNFTYEIDEVTVSPDNQPVVKFRILADGSPVTFGTYGVNPLLSGFTGSPSFLVAYALPQDGLDEPLDYNNLGLKAAQPATVSITNCWDGTRGTLTGPDGNGTYTATLNGQNNAARFPAGATLRAVALQGYFTQVSPAVARHTISATKAVTGDTVRRVVVDNAKCASCHEWFEGHGGNRVYNIDVCTFCHLPNLSTSGRAADLSGYVYGTNSNTDATIDALGWDNSLWPEDTNNLKDMIHGIHAAHVRENTYEFVRDRGTSGRFYYDWSHVTFPAPPQDCLSCHKPGTYELDSVPARTGALVTTTRTTYGDIEGQEPPWQADDARETVPNDTDLVNTPLSSSCFYCHDSDASKAHMEQNGGAINWTRAMVRDAQPFETCIVCHGPGKLADVEWVHSEENE